MIERDPQGAAGESWDLVVVGGGVYGVALALEAARRGLRPLVLERQDFGGATSWNSLRILHGGLRSLQRLDLRRFREFAQERAFFFRHFPDLVEPQPCLMPLYGEGLRRPAVLRAALATNDFLSRRRNDGVRPDRHLPDGRVLGVDETIERFPEVDRRGLQGAALWWDGALPSSERLLIEMLRWAASRGAGAAAWVEVTGLLAAGGRALGVAARDLVAGTELEFRAPLVVNCAGPWSRAVARRLDRDVPRLFHPSIAWNVLLDRPPLSDAALAVAPREPKGQTFFLLPWEGKVLAGTHHGAVAGGELPGGVPEEGVRAFLAEVDRAVPGAGLGQAGVLRVHWGALPAASPGSAELALEAVVHDHGAAGGPRGLWSVSGVKLTTARRVAEAVLRRISRSRGEPLPPVTGGGPPEPALPLSLADFDALRVRDPEAARAYVRRLAASEGVVRAEDLVLRRTSWGHHPADAARLTALVGPWLD